MQGEQVGAIYYEVAADTSKLTTAEKAVSDSMAKVEKSTKGADDAANKLTASKTKLASAMAGVTGAANKQRDAFGGLKGAIAAYLSMRTLQWVANLSDQYQQNASRIKNATQSTEEYAMVQERLLQTANGTYRSLGEAQEVYLSVGETLRGLKFNLTEVLDITDSFSYALVRDAARADQAATAMDAWSKAIQKGKIEGDAWASIMAATPSIVEGISAATGKSANEIRKLGATGKLSLEALNEGLLQSKEINKELAEQMAVSTKDAVTQLTNSFTVFFGKVNEASKASNVFTQNVADMANLLQDPDVINAGVDFANGIVTAMNAIIKGAKETVGMVKWMAENVAAAMNGPAAGDNVRQQDLIDKNERQIENLKKIKWNSFSRLLAGGKTRGEIDAEIKTLQEGIDRAKQLMKDYAGTTPTAPETVVEAKRTIRPKVNAIAKDDKKDKSGDNAAKKAAAEEKTRAKAAQDYINRLNDQYDKIEDMTHAEQVLRDVRRGSIKLKDDELLLAMAAATQLDERIAKEKDLNAALQVENDTLTAQRQLQSEILGYGLKLAGTMMGGGARQEMEERSQMEESFAKRMQQLQDQRRSDLNKASENEKARINKQYDETLAIEAAYQARSLEEYDKYTKRKAQLDGDWRVGAIRAIAEYKEAAEDMASQSANAFGNAAKSMEDALVKFAQTGKLSFTDFANSVIADIARMAAKQATSGIMEFIGGMVSAYFGTPSVSLGSGSSGSSSGGKYGSGANYSLGSGNSGIGLKPPGRANGGPVVAGGMYQVNERGTPELLNIGGNQYLMMGKQSGNVTPTSAGAGAAGAGGSGVQVNIYNSSDSEVSSNTRQGSNGQIIDVIIKKAVDATASSIASGGVVGSAIQTTFGLSRGPGTSRYGR